MLCRTDIDETPQFTVTSNRFVVEDCAERGLLTMEVQPQYCGDISPAHANTQWPGFDMTGVDVGCFVIGATNALFIVLQGSRCVRLLLNHRDPASQLS